MAPHEKCVLVLDAALPPGVLANTAAILGITLGEKRPWLVGADVSDAGGDLHCGIVTIPVPVLKGSAAAIRELRQKLYDPEYLGVTVVDFTSLAQGCRTYEEFTQKMRGAPGPELAYFGIALCGESKKVSKLTGSMPLLR